MVLWLNAEEEEEILEVLNISVVYWIEDEDLAIRFVTSGKHIPE